MADIRTPDGGPIAADGGSVGLALAGSGLKAALFHIGVLARLAELDHLRRIDVISATGGGAVIAALYQLQLKRILDVEGDIGSDRLLDLIAELEQRFVALVQTDLRARLFDNPFINMKRTNPHHTSAERFATLLDRNLFRPLASDDHRPVRMRDLAIHPRGDTNFNPALDNRNRYCKAPRLIINAANLATGRAWRFDAERMGEPTAGPASRRLSKAPLLAQSPYRRLPDAHAGFTLGEAVAAAMAAPGLLEPLHLPGLYPDPEEPTADLDVRLGDGRLADALGTDVLIEQGCARLIVSDASGFETPGYGPTDRACALQLAALEANRPGHVVLIHMLREIEALEVRPLGPIAKGHMAKDRGDDEITSYGVERSVQKLLAATRADLDAPSEIEAMSLMADGYLIARRAFHQHRQSGGGWAEDSLPGAQTWRFSAMIDALQEPGKALIRHLKAASRQGFSTRSLQLHQVLGAGLLALAAALTLVSLGAIWSAMRPAAGADSLWMLTTIALLALVAWLIGRARGDDRPIGLGARRQSGFSRFADALGALFTALPKALAARFQRRASRSFIKAGRLKRIGIEPVPASALVRPKPSVAPPVQDDRSAAGTETKAA